MRKVFFLLGIIFTLSILFLAGSTMAGPKQCPPGQRGNCSYYQQNTTGKYGCFPNSANLGNGWVKVSDKCPGKDKEEEKATNTAKPPEPKPTNTVLPKNPTNTPEKISDPKDGNKVLSTPEVLYVDSVEKYLACPEDCVCILLEQVVTQMSIENKLRLTDIGIQLTRNAILSNE